MTYSCLKVEKSFDPINAITIALLVLSKPTIAFMPVNVGLGTDRHISCDHRIEHRIGSSIVSDMGGMQITMG